MATKELMELAISNVSTKKKEVIIKYLEGLVEQKEQAELSLKSIDEKILKLSELSVEELYEVAKTGSSINAIMKR